MVSLRVVLTEAHPIRRHLTYAVHKPLRPATAYGVEPVASGPMAALRFRGPVLPDGEPADLYVVDGRVTREPQAGAESGAEGWIVPGLVDAHCHLGLDAHGAVDEATTEEQAVTDRDTGALLLRDCGSPADTRWVQQRDDLPRLIRCGRHIARTRRYIRHYAHEVEPGDLTTYVAQEARAGDGWVKLVGDWISRDEGDLAPSFPPDAFARAIATAHEHGARVTAHCFGETVLPDLIEAGIDCIEHGTGLSTELVETMAGRGTALVPTVVQLNNFPSYAEQGEARFPAYATHMRALYERRHETIMAAYDAGVQIFAGTDAGGVLPHGGIVDEILELAAYGMPAEYALGAASWRAREWLGWNATLDEGAPADFVVYPRDPLQDLSALHEPSAVVLRGRVV
jgi:imidazolonepropionase-like amidohydrolase